MLILLGKHVTLVRNVFNDKTNSSFWRCYGSGVKFIASLYRKCDSWRRLNPEPGTSAHPADRQKIGSSLMAAVT